MMPTMGEVGIDGRKLRRLRLGRGWTQKELADNAKVSPDTIVRWEGKQGQKPHPSALNKIAGALDVTPADLLED